MKFEIKHRYNGSILFSIETDSIKLAVEAAFKSSVGLSYSDLSYSDLRHSDLRHSDLRHAEGINKFLCTPLLFLHDQVGEIRAYKLVTKTGEGPFNGGITYKVGKSYSVKNANCDENAQCAAGISLATLDWCISNWQEGYQILIAEFISKDIASIPTATDGKFRVHKCKIVGKKKLKEIGILG